jgi:hypothetical protein
MFAVVAIRFPLENPDIHCHRGRGPKGQEFIRGRLGILEIPDRRVGSFPNYIPPSKRSAKPVRDPGCGRIDRDGFQEYTIQNLRPLDIPENFLQGVLETVQQNLNTRNIDGGEDDLTEGFH